MKAELRNKIKGIVSSLSDEDKNSKSISASKLFEAFLLDTTSINEIKSVGLYAALGDELNCEFIAGLSNIVTSYPSVENGEMVFRESSVSELIESHDFGVKIKAPNQEARVVVPDIILIPGRSFNKFGARLGRGKGYYDKYLEKFNGIKIGLCFEEQLLEEIPMDQHDQYMDFVITDKSLLRVAK